MADLEGLGNISPQQRAIYKQEFARGTNLFKQSFEEYLNSDNDNKKTLLKDVMDRSLQVMNETAKYVLSQKKLEQENKLEEDYENFISNETPDTVQQLKTDINKLQKGL